MRFMLALFLLCPACFFTIMAGEPTERWLTTRSVSEDWKRDSTTEIQDNLTPEAMQAALKESRAVWEQARAEHGNSYTLTRGFQSWTGFGHRTRITVRNGVIVERHFEAYNRDQEITDTYTEGPDELNSHQEGATAQTMEQLYDDCAANYLAQNPEKNSLSLEFTAQGILSSCTYSPYGCADDCSRGLNKITVSWEAE